MLLKYYYTNELDLKGGPAESMGDVTKYNVVPRLERHCISKGSITTIPYEIIKRKLQKVLEILSA
jgi:hypothetical protein